MNINSIKKSNYLTKEDCGDNGLLLTIKGFREENLALEGQPENKNWIMYFSEEEKGMVLKSVNAQLCAAILKSPETDDWIGKRVVLYNDPSIIFQGKLCGGIRVRAPRGQAANPPAAAPRPAPVQAPPAQPNPAAGFNPGEDESGSEPF